MTVEEKTRFEQFLKHLTGLGRSPRTVQGYRADHASFARWYAGSTGEPLDVGRLASVDIVQYRSWLQTVKEAKAATINRRLSCLKRYVRFAEAQGWIRGDVAARIREVSLASREPLAPRGLTQPQVRTLLRELELNGNARDEAIVHVLLYCGLRVGELTQLRRDDVEIRPRSGQLRIRAATAKRRRERTVPVPLAARKALGRYLEVQGDAGEECLFVGQRGSLGPAAVRHLLRQYGRRASITNLSPHTLRHTFAYAYLEQNPGDLVGLAQILGHADVSTTQIYTQKRLDDLAAGMERVAFHGA